MMCDQSMVTASIAGCLATSSPLQYVCSYCAANDDVWMPAMKEFNNFMAQDQHIVPPYVFADGYLRLTLLWNKHQNRVRHIKIS